MQFNDRLLAAEVRSLGLKHLAKILDDKYPDKEFQKEMLLKISSSLLPRLAEVTGENGKPIVIEVAREIAEQNGIKVK